MSLRLKQFFYICLMSKGPQDLPWSHQLLHVSLLAYLISGVLSMLDTTPFDQALLVMLVDLAVLLLYAWLCLQAFNKLSRFIQMATALAGVGTIFQLIAWPLLAYIDNQPETTASGLSIWLLFFVGWNLAVYAHIFRESFNVRMLSAFVLTLTYAVITVSVRQLLFPDAGV
ncbi:MAG: hypothetical protein QG652_1633 [Pseudomonadota bacterium]|nr:hypothetical protein [Pseudomonadota bacterium]